jgi:hypothetical protein
MFNLPPEVMKLAEDQVEAWRGYSPGYIFNHFKNGPVDAVVNFKGQDIKVLKHQDVLESKATARERSQFLAMIYKEWLDDPETRDVVNDFNFVVPISFSDMPVAKVQHIPSLCFSKNSFSNSILVPNMLSQVRRHEFGYVDTDDRPLSHKSDKMSFCGSLTNIYWNDHGIQYNQRLQVAYMATQSDVWDCKIIQPPQFDPVEWAEVRKSVQNNWPGLVESDVWCDEFRKVEVADQLKHKFQLTIDGHTCAWARLPWQMYSNSVVMKVRNPQDDFVEWFYPLLKNGKHLLEVDIHNIMEVYQYIIHEPEHQQSLNENASDFCRKYFDPDVANKFFLYTLYLLNKKQNIPEGYIK